MLQYKVPQDVQREDTIVGPLTLRHMAILGIGGGIAYALYVSLAKTYYMEIWLPPIVIISALTLAFAFLKIHNLPFHIFLMCFLEYNLLAKKRVWVQGAGIPFYIPQPEHKITKRIQKDLKIDKQKKSLKELGDIVDTHGSKELDEAEKKEELTKMINQNYN